MNLGETIKLCRKKKGLTQAQLSEKAGISMSHLCLMEKNKRDPSLNAIKLIADALEIPLSVLMFLAAQTDQVQELSESQIEQLTHSIMELMINATKQQSLI
ncbi:helix-turn-helix domain-containing protein [Pseudomonadota bacterium]